MVSLEDVEDSMVSELKVSLGEAKVYLLLLDKGKMSKSGIAKELKLKKRDLEKSLTGLIEKGACIELGEEYEALNPRFAITNMYRMMCYANGIEVKRNVIVDQMATLLEKPYEDARTK